MSSKDLKLSSPQCRVCGKICYTICTHCRQVFYCCVEHQRQDIVNHYIEFSEYSAIVHQPYLGVKFAVALNNKQTDMTVELSGDGYINIGSRQIKVEEGTYNVLLNNKKYAMHVQNIGNDTTEHFRDIELSYLKHPNIINIHGHGYIKQGDNAAGNNLQFGVITDRGGITLKTYLTSSKKRDEVDAKIILYQILRAIYYMQTNGVFFTNITLDDIIIYEIQAINIKGKGNERTFLKPVIVNINESISYSYTLYNKSALESVVNIIKYTIDKCNGKVPLENGEDKVFNDYTILQLIELDYINLYIKMYVESIVPAPICTYVNTITKNDEMNAMHTLQILDTKPIIQTNVVHEPDNYTKMANEVRKYVYAITTQLRLSLDEYASITPQLRPSLDKYASIFKAAILAMGLLHLLCNTLNVNVTQYAIACYLLSIKYRYNRTLLYSTNENTLTYERYVLIHLKYKINYVTAADYLDQYLLARSTPITKLDKYKDYYELCMYMHTVHDTYKLHPSIVAMFCICAIEERVIYPTLNKKDIDVIKSIQYTIRNTREQTHITAYITGAPVDSKKL